MKTVEAVLTARKCYFTIRGLEGATRLSKSEIKRQLADLQKRCYLSVIQVVNEIHGGHRARANAYRLTKDAIE